MKRKAIFAHLMTHIGSHFHFGLRSVWFSILLFLLSLQHSTALAARPVSHNLLTQNSATFFSANNFFNTGHLPLELLQVQQVKEAPTENDAEEEEEEVEDESPILAVHKHSKGALTIRSTAIPIAFVSFQHCNRSSVPLFILYHSWKSFIA